MKLVLLNYWTLVCKSQNIVKDCHSVVVIASVLANLDKKERLWQEVAKSIKSHVSENLNPCLNILDLSNMHLP